MKRNQYTALLRLLSSSLRLGLAFGAAGVFASTGFAAGAHKDTYYVNDHLASTVATSDAAGEIAQIEADAFGTQAGATAPNARFTGKPYDADLGAYVFPFRNYRTDEARWMSADPSGFPDGVNAVFYAPKPTYQFDAFGLAAGDIYQTYSAAANAALTDAHTSTASTGNEYGGHIGSVNGGYTYSIIGGTQSEVLPGDATTPAGFQSQAMFHSHPTNGTFSNNDINHTWSNTQYVVDREGLIWETYRPDPSVAPSTMTDQQYNTWRTSRVPPKFRGVISQNPSLVRHVPGAIASE